MMNYLIVLIVTFCLFIILDSYYDKKNVCKDNDKQFYGDGLMNYVLILIAIGMTFSIIYYIGNQFVIKIKGDADIQLYTILGIIALQNFTDSFLVVWLFKFIEFLGKKEYEAAKKKTQKNGKLNVLPLRYKKPFNIGVVEIELTLVMMKASCLLIALCAESQSMFLLFASSLIKTIFDGPSGYYKAKIEQKEYQIKLLQCRKKFAFCYIAAYYIFILAFAAALLETTGVKLSSAATAFGIMSGFLLLLAKPYFIIVWNFMKEKATIFFLMIAISICIIKEKIKEKNKQKK